LLGCDASHIVHVNKGRRRFGDEKCHLLMEAAETDTRLAGLSVLHLRPELAQWGPYFCRLCPRDRKRQAKKKAKRAR
jgi:hypothetical protein